VQKAIDATEIDECTVVGEVLDDTGDLHAFLEILEQFFALGAVLFFHHRAAGDHDVVTLLVQLDDLELEVLALEVGRVAHGTDIHQGARQEAAHLTQVDGEPALDLAADLTRYRLFRLEGLLEYLPCLVALGLFARQAGGTETVLDGIQRDFHLVANGDLEFSIGGDELLFRDHAFRLEAGVHHDEIVVDIHDGADDDGTRFQVEVGNTLFKEFSKAFGHEFKFLMPSGIPCKAAVETAVLVEVQALRL